MNMDTDGFQSLNSAPTMASSDVSTKRPLGRIDQD